MSLSPHGVMYARPATLESFQPQTPANTGHFQHVICEQNVKRKFL